MHVRWVVILILVAFAAGAGVVVAWRMTSEALAVMLGIVAGVLVSVPTSLIITWATLQQAQAAVGPHELSMTQVGTGSGHAAPQAQQPPVIVVTPQGSSMGGGGWAANAGYMPPMQSTAPPRRFNVIGDEQGWETNERTRTWPAAAKTGTEEEQWPS